MEDRIEISRSNPARNPWVRDWLSGCVDFDKIDDAVAIMALIGIEYKRTPFKDCFIEVCWSKKKTIQKVLTIFLKLARFT